MATYNLSDNVQDTFNFVLRDKKYAMRYPRTDEIEQIQDLTVDLQEAQDSKDNALVTKLSGELEDKLYEFISPEGHEVSIKEALSKENIRVMRNFNTMIKTELAIQ